MPEHKSTVCTPYVHPDDPACRLKPDEPFMVGGLDWSWAFTWFKDIPGKPGHRVGFDGSVWSCIENVGGRYTLTDRWHLRKPRPNRRGYLRISIGSGQTRSVHHLVLEAFVGPCPPGLECRHLDGNPANNRLENLAWGTHKANAADMVRHGRAGGPRAVLTDSAVREALAMRATGATVASIAMHLGTGYSTIASALRGEAWTHITGLSPDRPGHLKGENNHNAVLTDADVLEALAMHQAGKSQRSIARWFGVTHQTIGAIFRGVSWNHLTGLPPYRNGRGTAKGDNMN